MTERINIFSLARRGHSGEENQLTELLAFLLQQHPDIVSAWLEDLDSTVEWPAAADWRISTQHVLPTRRRPDLLLEAPGLATILVEVKVRSGEGPSQLADYAHHLASERSEPIRRLIYLAKDDVAAAPAAVHTTPDVSVYAATWQRLEHVFRTQAPDPLVNDFAEMLREEGLAMPEPVTAEDLHQWEAAAIIIRQLQQLLDAARPGLESLVPERNWVGPLSTSLERIYRLYASETILYGVGFNPGSLWGYPAIIDFYVLNKRPSPAERRKVARGLQAAHPDLVSAVEWGETPKRSLIATDVLTGTSFNEQVGQVVAFAEESLHLFREAGYPPESFQATGPPAADEPHP